jgi:pyruvate dehydrogenase E2 component (dihydrolipoamide acetyltransferase)
MPDVAMPRLSDSMEEGTILKWLKSDGDEVQRGEELVEIETDKANMTYEADQDGTLEIVAEEGATLPVGDVIARIGGGGGSNGAKPDAAEDDAAESPRVEPGGEEGDEEAKGTGHATEEQGDGAAEDEQRDGAPKGEQGDAKDEQAPERPAPSANGDGERVKASPVARRMARELGVDLARLQGTGPGGRIVKADVEGAEPGEEPAAEPQAEEAPAAEAATEQPAESASDVPPPITAAASGDADAIKGETRTQDLTKTQQVVARRMAESKATAPDFVLNAEVDMDEAVELRKQLKAAAGDRAAPSFNDLVIKASALALRDFPRANGAYRDGRFELYSRVNVGVAVAGQDALIVPTLFDADRKSIGTIAHEARVLAERVRAGAITPPELSGGTFTVSNLGMYGIKHFTAVINPPQAAILAVGALEPRPVVRDGELAIGQRMDLTLACDHRILYGADAAEFLGRIRERLEQPYSLAF